MLTDYHYLSYAEIDEFLHDVLNGDVNVSSADIDIASLIDFCIDKYNDNDYQKYDCDVL